MPACSFTSFFGVSTDLTVTIGERYLVVCPLLAWLVFFQSTEKSHDIGILGKAIERLEYLGNYSCTSYKTLKVTISDISTRTDEIEGANTWPNSFPVPSKPNFLVNSF